MIQTTLEVIGCLICFVTAVAVLIYATGAVLFWLEDRHTARKSRTCREAVDHINERARR